MLSVAKHLAAHRERPFASLRVTRGPCHAERSEASRCPVRETLRFAQGDTKASSLDTKASSLDTKASSLVAIDKCRNP